MLLAGNMSKVKVASYETFEEGKYDEKSKQQAKQNRQQYSCGQVCSESVDKSTPLSSDPLIVFVIAVTEATCYN